MIQVSSPGLPPWPKVWFDRNQSRAVIKAKHATWRSYEWAYRVTEGVVWLINLGIVFVVWQIFATPELILREFFVFVAVFVCFPMVAIATRAALHDALARQVFATATVFWVTEESIDFKSWLYSSPVVIWRKWKGKPIGVKFLVQQDADASRYIADRQQRKWPRSQIDEAAIIGIVVATPSGYDGEMPVTSGSLQRSIPISETSSRLAQKFTTAFNAALMLVPLEEQTTGQTVTQGVDIDSAT